MQPSFWDALQGINAAGDIPGEDKLAFNCSCHSKGVGIVSGYFRGKPGFNGQPGFI
jgi:hypothetical protein